MEGSSEIEAGSREEKHPRLAGHGPSHSAILVGESDALVGDLFACKQLLYELIMFGCFY